MLALMAIAAVADAVTFLALPRGGEANPIVAALLAISPVIAVAAKAALVLALIGVWERLRGRLRTVVYAVASIAWSFGALTNVLTIASWRFS